MSLILTKAGLNAYAQSEATGIKLQATHMAVGDGGGAPVSHTDTSEALVNETWRGELQSIDVAASGEVEFTGHIPITVGGWYIREVALYADDTLLALGGHPETWKPAPEAPDKVELVITAPVKFANADNINLTVDTTKVLASQEYVAGKIEQHNASEDAHAALFAGLDDHIARDDNPHGVVAGQVGFTPSAGLSSSDVQAAVCEVITRAATHNYLINGAFVINQRQFAGGALDAGEYGYDRWKAGDAGATCTVADGVLTLSAGSIVQVVESPALAGEKVTLSAKLSADATISGKINGTAGALPLTVDIPAEFTGDLDVELMAGDGSASEVKLEIGGTATAYRHRHLQEELALCQRYYWQSQFGDRHIWSISVAAGSYHSQVQVELPVSMRVRPTMMMEGPWTFYQPGTGAYVEGPTIAAAISHESVRVSVQNSNNDNTLNFVLGSNNNEVLADAEL
ncbi:hypothetical protein BerOc1_02987 [Pseudodesulfovibrio hydrargyri]|uniref:Phage tail fibre protein N-terminal domain-containing protein n=1 Tax=Pseudodesulfovibrio hydrargyri TaxID=2125990 RepID=A0A1J5MYG5_9BACT|nr:phage tail protein [Pseudodesulfovibrio hydrargyri]OIQ51042.1 hypothetical protein BerOc1_02987 [Pseudodesulfovibrio hydrargyri]